MGLVSLKNVANYPKYRRILWCDLEDGTGEGEAYKYRFGLECRNKLQRYFDLVCITTIMEQISAEENRLFKDTWFKETWKI